jgi:hypothetical protein
LSDIENEKSQIDMYLSYTLENLESPETEKEVEFKVFLALEKDEHKIINFHSELQQKIIEFLS